MPDLYEELRSVLSSYLTDNPGEDLDLANEFQVAISTVKRWARGTAKPHPRLAEMIITYIIKRSTAG